MMRAVPGQPTPVGVTPVAGGANVSVVAPHARAVDLCVLVEGGSEERVRLPELDFGVWHGFVAGLAPGMRYGLRAHGPFDPAAGHRFDPSKLLVDPYARALDGVLSYGPEIFSLDAEGGMPGLDSAGSVPWSVVVDPAFDWGDDAPPRRRYADTVVYETHVRGLTMRHPDVPPELRGTYAGLAHPAVVEHLVGLGVTAVELLPVHHSVTEPSVHARGLTNYWGYNTLAYFAPHAPYSARVREGERGGQVVEFQEMVKTLHAAGIEVVLDVVYNHTAEAGADGPTLSLRGLSNAAYYRLDPQDPSRYIDTTGCGNSLSTDSPAVLRLVMDSLRYWVEVMHVDGFRFDLASTLGREAGVFAPTASFFDIVVQDPVLSQVKLIAEPWDVGQADSYGVGRFPALWREWNGAYRDTVRDFWRGTEGLLGAYATRMTGSSDLYGGTGLRRPTASVNFVTAHDGFTLRDLVSYDRKHNEANGEENRDGTDGNLSWNHGAEGPTDDPAVLASRAQAQRTLLAALLTSFGVPMILGGDEIGRTQGGNNNGYCLDDETVWYDWDSADQDLLAFTRRLLALRRDHPVLRRRRFLAGTALEEIAWFAPSGRRMSDADWSDPGARAIALHLDGQDDPDLADDGSPMLDDDVVVMVNGWWEPLDIVVPAVGEAVEWHVVLDTADPDAGLPGHELTYAPGAPVTLAGRSLVVLLGPVPMKSPTGQPVVPPV
ncbi:MAG: glycogen debranching protein GlgX [Actinobacteria bacterium]|nr:glycogen debranching protein GlgX [Actinomycetota bacterium]